MISGTRIRPCSVPAPGPAKSTEPCASRVFMYVAWSLTSGCSKVPFPSAHAGLAVRVTANGSKADILTGLEATRAWVISQDEENLATARAYLEGKGAFPQGCAQPARGTLPHRLLRHRQRVGRVGHGHRRGLAGRRLTRQPSTSLPPKRPSASPSIQALAQGVSSSASSRSANRRAFGRTAHESQSPTRPRTSSIGKPRRIATTWAPEDGGSPGKTRRQEHDEVDRARSGRVRRAA